MFVAFLLSVCLFVVVYLYYMLLFWLMSMFFVFVYQCICCFFGLRVCLLFVLFTSDYFLLFLCRVTLVGYMQRTALIVTIEQTSTIHSNTTYIRYRTDPEMNKKECGEVTSHT